MRILCQKHGLTEAIEVSPDIWEATDAGQAIGDVDVVSVLYTYEGDVVDPLYVSAAFAEEHGIEGGVAPSPVKYPEWVHLLRRYCRKCVEQTQGGVIDEDRRWRANDRQG